MGVTCFTQEFTCPVAPARMFKALILDSNNLIPKLLPQFIKSVELIEGDGGAGSIELVNFTADSNFKYVKHRIDEVDKEKYMCKYTMIEGDPLGDKLESIAYDVRFEAAGNGGGGGGEGCICKMITKYHTVGEVEIKEEEIKSGKDSAMGVYRVVEAYLLHNPHVYA